MNCRQAIYEQSFLRELEDLFFYSNVLGNGKTRINELDVSGASASDRMQAQILCRDWVDEKLLGRFNNDIFKEPADISVKFDKALRVNWFQVEGETYKLLMYVDTSGNGFSVFLRSMLKEDE